MFVNFSRTDNKNRDRLEIVCDMLNAVKGRVKKTRIMYQANLSYGQLEKYLSLLLENGLLECDENSCYLLTPRGKEFLRAYAAYVEKFGRIKREIEQTAQERLKLENLFLDNNRRVK